MKPITLYSMSRNYTSLTIWEGDRKTRSRIGETTIRPNKGFTREQRYRILGEALFEQTGIPAPAYRP